MSNEFEAYEHVQKPEQKESDKDTVAPLNLLDLTVNEMNHHHRHNPNPWPFPPHRPPSSHVGGTQIEVHNGKIVVHRN